MNFVRSLRKDSFKEFLNAIKSGDLQKVKNTCNQDFINKRILDEPNGLRPIHVACAYDLEEIVKYLIDRGCDFEQKTNESLLPIHIACLSGAVNVVDVLLKKKNQLETETKERFRPVHFACKYGHADVLLMLINNKCNITCQTIDGYTPLHLACETGMVDVVRILLTYNCPVDIVAKNGIRPIDLAKNHKDVLVLLAEKNCVFDFKANYSSEVEINVEDLDNYGNELFKCVRENNFNRFVIIFDSENPIMNDSETELTLMECSISEKAYEFVDHILSNNLSSEKFEKYFVHFKEKNKDIFNRILEEYEIYRAIRFDLNTDLKSISILNQNCVLTGSSFFELASKYGSLDTVRQIMVKLVTRNENSWNQVKKMAQENLNSDLFKLITDREKYLESRSEALWTRLHIAVDDNDLDMVKYLLRSDQDFPTSCSPSIGSPLNLAAICGRIECVKLLLAKFSTLPKSFHVLIKNGMGKYCLNNFHLISDINEIDEEGNTMLHLSAKFLSMKLCEMLLDGGACPNLKNHKGNTALHEMVVFNFSRIKQIENEFFVISRLLLDRKTDINLKNCENKSIFQECLLLKNVNLILSITNDREDIVLTRNDLQIIMDNNWIDVLELVLPQALDAYQFIDEDMLMYFLKNRSAESFNRVWFQTDDDIKKSCVSRLLYQSAIANKPETFHLLCDESECDNKLFSNGDTLLISLLRMQKQDLIYKLINSKLSWLFVNQCNSRMETPLHIAAKNGLFDLLENMLYISESINPEDIQGCTPLSILINGINQSEEIEKLARLIISKAININQDCTSLLKTIENCEKDDLKLKLEKVYKLESERKTKNAEAKNICNVCVDREINISFDCGHTCCKDCSIQLKICPICRKPIRSRNALFL